MVYYTYCSVVTISIVHTKKPCVGEKIIYGIYSKVSKHSLKKRANSEKMRPSHGKRIGDNEK
jgi:hypothetical protein